jgi:hypothetical protein
VLLVLAVEEQCDVMRAIGIASKQIDILTFFSLDTAGNGAFTQIIKVPMYEKCENVVSGTAVQGQTRSTPSEQDIISQCREAVEHLLMHKQMILCFDLFWRKVRIGNPRSERSRAVAVRNGDPAPQSLRQKGMNVWLLETVQSSCYA